MEYRVELDRAIFFFFLPPTSPPHVLRCVRLGVEVRGWASGWPAGPGLIRLSAVGTQNVASADVALPPSGKVFDVTLSDPKSSHTGAATPLSVYVAPPRTPSRPPPLLSLTRSVAEWRWRTQCCASSCAHPPQARRSPCSQCSRLRLATCSISAAKKTARCFALKKKNSPLPIARPLHARACGRRRGDCRRWAGRSQL